MTRTERLIDDVRSRILSGALAPGDRLASVRRYAALMMVSPSTVVEAYERLAAEGVIRARRGSGFYVSGISLAARSLTDNTTPLLRDVDPFWVSRQSLDAGKEELTPGCGWLPADWMPNEALRKGLRQLTRLPDTLLTDYGSTHGSTTLRRLLLARFAQEGLSASMEQLMLTGSGSQALDLLCRFLLRPGDSVVVDDPCYFNFQALLRTHQVNIVGVPYTSTGPDIAVFEQVLATVRPRLYITNSALHNPTGACLSAQTAYRVLSAAAAHETLIIEDDIFADFEPEPSPRLAIPDGLDRVIRMGSFSKTLSASVRCGYIACRAEWIEGLADLQIATNFGGPSPLSSELIANVLGGGSYRKHLNEVTTRLDRARKEAIEHLDALGITPWMVPRGGFYLWCRLPEGIDSTAIARRCRQDGVVLAPGNVFSVTQSAAEFLRFNVAHLNTRVFSVLKRAIAEHQNK
ncbi:aminotransferase-like domain-containing protein [Erwinia sorbitola]|uniref:Aminotransferase class I/II-fold pyridoxal phosphate-dependent enzyme n=1 Tax=Erwinia sorbitola TaxID=2681984 RepID=A0ABW9RGJ4_9GAMM|nr:PLP-dependent aminotransferase family protein [Erwinia sorbitola]MTD29335.1 aminotransferase class I/II-fold pyridoxal phosphate-dependent enzyme [Erwinia sorbitola]